MRIFDGKSASRAIRKDLKEKIAQEKINPVLAIILAGNDEASRIYIKLKQEAGKEIGIEVRHYIFDQNADTEELLHKIKQINNDDQIDGLIVQLPLPKKFDENRIIRSIDPKKDVDGFHQQNKKYLEENKKPNFFPVLPKAILYTLREAFGGDFKDKKFIALVNSDIFGQVLSSFLKREGIDLIYVKGNAVRDQKTRAILRSADALISVCGRPKLITKDNIKKGVALIDAGITRDIDGIVKGDVDKESVKGKASFITPVPGGIGPLTVAFLLKNVYLSSLRKKHSKYGKT